MTIGWLIGLGVVLAGVVAAIGAAVFWSLKRQHHVLEAQFSAHAQTALGEMMKNIVGLAREQLGAEKREISQTIARDLQTQSETFKEITRSLKGEIDERQREIRQLEEDRNRKFGQISQALTDYKALTEELRGSTEQLKKVLSNNQLRGSWGEIQAEKILEAAGMIAGQHYAKQTPIADEPNLRPDFTLYLPNRMELYVDVKFPLNSLQSAMATDDKAEADRWLKQFGDDLKVRMKEVAKYVVNRSQSVDYVILFVPSESVFEIINRRFSGLIDASFGQRIILASPHSFFAIVRTIQESYTHFYYEQNLKEILKHLQDLLDNFGRFQTEFGDVGRALAATQDKYQRLTSTRYQQIAKATAKINQYQLDSGADDPTLLPSSADANEEEN